MGCSHISVWPSPIHSAFTVCMKFGGGGVTGTVEGVAEGVEGFEVDFKEVWSGLLLSLAGLAGFKRFTDTEVSLWGHQSSNGWVN